MNKRLLVLSLLFVSLVLLYLSSDIPLLDGFQNGGDGLKVVIAKADWCGHCQKAGPEFEKLKQSSPIKLSNGKQATVEILDADQNKSEMAAYSVKGFPTILIIKGSETIEYPGERTYDAVVDFLNKQ
jgi:thioredoxin domain-containing protein 10